MGIGGVYHFTVSDIDSDVTAVPKSKPRNFGERINRTFLGGVLKHRICADVGHTVCAVRDTAAFTVVPAVALNQPDAVRSPSAEPVCLDKVCLAADLVGILLGFRVQRFLRKHLAVATPYIAPAVGLCLLCPFHKVKIILAVRIGETGGVDAVGTNGIHYLAVILGFQFRAECGVDGRDELLVRLILRKAPNELIYKAVRFGVVI